MNDFFEVSMDFKFIRYQAAIDDFVCAETLMDIDCGTVDLSGIMDVELKDVLYYCAELLEVELRINYMTNPTGIFRVSRYGKRYCYDEFGRTIKSDSIGELKKRVLEDSGIWYVFDDIKAKELR